MSCSLQHGVSLFLVRLMFGRSLPGVTVGKSLEASKGKMTLLVLEGFASKAEGFAKEGR